MDFPEYKYTEFCKGNYTSRKPPTIIEIEQVSQYRADNPHTPAWISHFRFREDFKTYCQENNSVTDYAGLCYSGNLWFDVDVGDKSNKEKIHVEALGKALELTKNLLNVIMREYEYPADGLRCYFTGSKGFNVGMFIETFGLEPCKDFNDKCKYLVMKIAAGIELDAGLYDKTHLLRIPNTPNDLSGLYKIPLTVNEILECNDINKIIEMAEKPRKLDLELIDPSEVAGELAHLMDDYSAQPHKPTPGTPTATKKGKHDYAAILRGELEGSSRTGNLTYLTEHWQKQGIPMNEAKALGWGWDKANGLGLDDDLQYKNQYPIGKVAGTIEDMYIRYGTESEDIPRNEPIDGKTFVNMTIPKKPMLIGGGLIPGFGFTIMAGYAKAGKTTLAMQMCLSTTSGTKLLNTFNIEKENAKVLYVYLENDPAAIQETFKSQIANWGAEIDPTNVSFVEAHGMCLDYIEDREWLQSHLEGVDLCVIDPVSLAMKGNMNDYEVVRAFATMIKTIGRETDTAFLLIHNLKKPGAVKQDPMFLICGSTAWINIAESIITLGRWDETKLPSYSRLAVKPRYAPEPEDLCIYRNNNTFELADPDRIPKVRTENVVNLVKDMGPIGYNALTQALMEAESVSRRTATRKIQQAVKDELITRNAQDKYICPQKEII